MSGHDEALVEHRPVIGTFAGKGGIVGCSCLSARDYRAAGHRAGTDGWIAHLGAVLDAVADDNARLA